VIKDGFKNLKNATMSLMDEYPKKVGTKDFDELVEHMEKEVKSWQWVRDAQVRFRESGQVYFGEVYVIAHETLDIESHIQEGMVRLKEFHWKIHDVTICPVAKF